MHQYGDDVITAPHQNSQATAMSIDVSGNLALLGSRRNLTLIDLNKPKEVLKKVNLNRKWDISQVKWNPFEVNQHYFLTTYNQYADLWHYNLTTASRIFTFTGHSRAISDIDWSSTDANLLATCSLDQYIYLWDIRETKKPKLVTSTVSGASCVRWNKFDEHTLASSHDGSIRIWDIRNGKAPTQYITAHVSSINYLDWSPKNKDELASAGQDTKISFWNTAENPRLADFQIQMQHPILRAEYTPFGTAMAALSMQNFRETPFTLWNYVQNLFESIHDFNGHTDVVLDFQWRKNNEVIWQLVTWSKDQILRLWPIDYSLFAACGGDLSVTAEQYEASLGYPLDSTAQEPSKTFAPYNSSISSVDTQTSETIHLGNLTPDFSEKINYSSSPGSTLVSSNKSRGGANTSFSDTLDQEFRLLNACLPNLTLNQMDITRRLCTVTLRTTTQFFVLQITFPVLYPQNEAPIFNIISHSDNIDKNAQDKLLLTLHETAQHHVRNNRACLEPCLRQLTTKFREMSYNSEGSYQDSDASFGNSLFSFPYGSSQYRPLDLRNIPFPRTSGARFCSAGYLVFFTRPTEVKGFYTNTDKMPRSMTGLMNTRRSVPVVPHIVFEKPFPSKQLSYNEADSVANLSVSSFFYKEKRPRRARYLSNLLAKDQDHLSSSIPNHASSKHSKVLYSAGRVVIVDMTRIMPISKGLASNYIVPEQNNFSEACKHNKEKAACEDMPDLVQLWSCVSYLPNPNQTEICNEYVRPFQGSPLGRFFLSNLLEHYSKLKDVQTLAMLACTFDPQLKPRGSPIRQRTSHSYASAVKRSLSHQSFDVMPDSYFGLHKSSSESKFPEHQPSLTNWLSNMITARSPTTSESSMSKYYKTPPESPPSDDYKYSESEFIDSPLDYRERWHADCRMLEGDNEMQYNAFKTSYCSLLERWKVNTKVAEIKKHISAFSQPALHEYKPICQKCGETKCTCTKDCQKCRKTKCTCTKDCQKCGETKCTCTNCFSVTIRCVICQLPVKSMLSFCGKCKHGGHLQHLQAWFRDHKHCPFPYGCECNCIFTPNPG